MSTLRVAPCPRCNGPIVFGERTCLKCGQTFDYGPNAPPVPSLLQVSAALSAQAAASSTSGEFRAPTAAQLQQAQPPAQTPQMQAPARTNPGFVSSAVTNAGLSSREGAAVNATPPMDGLDTGRAAAIGDVPIADVPGFMESSIYAAATPAHVQTSAVEGMERTAQQSVGAVRGTDVPGIYHSDFLKAPDNVVVANTLIQDIDLSPNAGARDVSNAKARVKAKAAELGKITCRCGEPHRFERCPSCGTLHPALQAG